MTKEQAFQKFVKLYDIEVPEEQVEKLYDFFVTQTLHNLQYDTLTSGTVHLNKREILSDMEEELRQNAYYEAKSDLVMKELIKKLAPEVTEEDLQKKAEEIMKKENSSLEMVQMFFGKDLSGLKRGVQEDKVKEYILEQVSD